MAARDPIPPTNVRLVSADGEEIPLELDYVGVDDDGIHVWNALVPDSFVPAASLVLRVSVWPAKTAIQFGLSVQGGGA
ncbi:hypothetical protein BJY24_007830 [Nocardia transvalensis]|uniref:Uncharacterized protein n=1 Tax=Nocardia transvalensis TaxID=37333 RepID=A0A7W9UMR9_9NOCA|nr:hypothetical protein [Nocardia transvalensis]MBB5918918.1 hypothetical protein [Nocardia transvalensis]